MLLIGNGGGIILNLSINKQFMLTIQIKFLWMLYLAFSILITSLKFKDLYYKTNNFPKLIIVWIIITFFIMFYLLFKLI